MRMTERTPRSFAVVRNFPVKKPMNASAAIQDEPAAPAAGTPGLKHSPSREARFRANTALAQAASDGKPKPPTRCHHSEIA